MTLDIKQYKTNPEKVSAVIVTEENIRRVAFWCSGKVFLQDDATLLRLPTLDGPIEVDLGAYVVHNEDDNTFYAMEAEVFEAKFKQRGIRGGAGSERRGGAGHFVEDEGPGQGIERTSPDGGSGVVITVNDNIRPPLISDNNRLSAREEARRRGLPQSFPNHNGGLRP